MEPIFSNQANVLTFTFRDLLSIVFKHKALILTSFLFVTILVSLGMFYLPPVYVSSGKVLIDTEQQGTPTFYSGIAAYRDKQQSDPVNRRIETEMELIEARPIAEQVVKELNLQYWDVYHKPFVYLLAPVADIFDEGMESIFDIKPNLEKRGFSDTVTALINSLKVEPVKTKSSETTSNLVQVSLKAPSDETVTRTLQKIMEVYRDHDAKIKWKAAMRATEIVNNKIVDAHKRLRQTQMDLKKFLTNEDSSIANPGPLTSPRDRKTVALLKEQLIDKEMELTEARAGYKKNNDKIRKIESVVVRLKQRLNDAIINEAEYVSHFKVLERDVTASETVYLDLKKRLSQIDFYLEMNKELVGNRRIVEPAIWPRESTWKKDLVLTVLGSFAGLVLGFGLAGLKEYLDHTLTGEKEVSNLFNLDVLGTIPWVEDEQMEVYLKQDPQEESI